MKSVALGKTTHTFMAKWFPSQHVHHAFNLSYTPVKSKRTYDGCLQFYQDPRIIGMK